MNNILSIKNLSKKYYSKKSETLAIKDITLDIKKNDFIAIVGPSGCGKSTLLSILSEIEKQTKGTIEYPNGPQKIGYMFQQDCLFPWLTILDNCLLGLKIQKKLTPQKKEKVIELLKNYGLEKFINKYPNSLSGGMKQRAALIRTLATDPDILLLDEAFSALDYQTRLTVSDDVYKIIKKEKKTAIMVTHDVGEAVSMANKVIVLTNRPSTIKKIVNINLTEAKSPIYNRKSKEFMSYYNEIWESIDNHV